MKYIIDSANYQEIDEVLKMGIRGVTANASMYLKNDVDFYEFIKKYTNEDLEFLSGEVMSESLEGMIEETERLIALNNDIVIKINFSKEGLELCHLLHKRGIKTAVTLIFNVNQAIAAINAGADYLFPFIGRNDEIGADGLSIIKAIQDIITLKGYKAKVVAASIKNLNQLTKIALYGIDYAAVPYNLYMRSLDHELTVSGAKQFSEDFKKVKKEYK